MARTRATASPINNGTYSSRSFWHLMIS